MEDKVIFETGEYDEELSMRYNFKGRLVSEIFEKASIVSEVNDDAFKCVQLSHIDWDGYSCVGLLKTLIEEKSISRVTNTGYSNIGKNFMAGLNFLKDVQYGVYFITDVSFDDGLWLQLMVQSALYPNIDFVYIDHHGTSLTSFQNTFLNGVSQNNPNVHVLINTGLNSGTELFARHLYENGFINGTTMGLASLVSVWDVQLTGNPSYNDAADFNQVLVFFNNIEKNNDAMAKSFAYTEASPAIYTNIKEVVTDILVNLSKDVTKDDVLGVAKNKYENIFRKVEQYISNLQSENGIHVFNVMSNIPGVKLLLNTIMDEYPDITGDEILVIPNTENTLTTMSMLIFAKYKYNIIIDVAMLGDRIVFGLRSRKGTYAINKVCSKLKGGGHPNAAGCAIGFDGKLI